MEKFEIKDIDLVIHEEEEVIERPFLQLEIPVDNFTRDNNSKDNEPKRVIIIDL